MSNSDKNVCDDQDKFNNAFNRAVDYLEKKNRPSMLARLLSGLIVLLIIGCAIFLAFKAPESTRQIHLVLAFVFAPFYIISYVFGAPKRD